MAASSKTQLLETIYNLLKKRYKLEPRAGRMSVLEAVLYGICHEGTTRENANQALSRFKDAYYDWNEVRVSPLHELQETLVGIPRRHERAEALRRFLRQLFEKTYSFTLDELMKKPLKEAVKVLQEYEALRSDFVLATVIQKALGGHALPIDGRVRLALERLGVADSEVETTALRAALERAIPKNRGEDFIDLLEELCHDTCLETLPECGRCELRKLCPTGIKRSEEEREALKAARKAPPKAAGAGRAKGSTEKAGGKKPSEGHSASRKTAGRGGAATPKRRGSH
ncbi:MAG: hypothetical protein KatS3mg108_3312 [Isosphaeraceae bacterium]|jgi:endonuclease-3|nr:MAG: hypothetical protein KatS3mg108_3312 [Isosphaeraceae bacterium]